MSGERKVVDRHTAAPGRNLLVVLHGTKSPVHAAPYSDSMTAAETLCGMTLNFWDRLKISEIDPYDCCQECLAVIRGEAS